MGRRGTGVTAAAFQTAFAQMSAARAALIKCSAHLLDTQWNLQLVPPRAADVATLVGDPDLVRELEAANVRFTGARENSCLTLLASWRPRRPEGCSPRRRRVYSDPTNVG